MQTAQRGRAFLVLGIVGLTLTANRAQAADPPAAPVPAGLPESPRNTVIPLGMLMEQNGGSLFRAESEYRASVTPPPDKGEPTHPNGPAGSLASVSFFSVPDPKAKTYKAHDLVTIIAKEQSAFTSNGNSTLTKNEDLDSQLNSFIALRPSKLQLNSIISGGSNFPQIQFQNERDFKGTGEVDRTDTLSDRITAEVVDVKPNGTLVLQAIKQIKTDEEEQRMVLTGVCRAEDVTADNTVLTTQLFDLELTQTHQGAVTDTTSRGFIPRLLDTFSPF